MVFAVLFEKVAVRIVVYTLLIVTPVIVNSFVCVYSMLSNIPPEGKVTFNYKSVRHNVYY